MPHVLPTSVNETISEKTGDYYPVFYNDFAAQSVETLLSVLWHTDWMRRIVVDKHDRSSVIFFLLNMVGSRRISFTDNQLVIQSATTTEAASGSLASHTDT